MYRKALIPLDGSPFAERVLPYVEWLVLPEETELLLLHVLRPFGLIVPPELLATTGLSDYDRLRERMENYLKGIKGELREMGFVAHAQLVEGDVASAICDVADAQEVDLIAMTTHGRSGVSRWAFGSVADRVIRHAAQPVFLVRGDTEASFGEGVQRILVPLDGSKLAERALPHAQTLAQAHGAEILLVRIVEPPSDLEVAELYVAWESPEKLYRHRQTAAEQYLGRVQERLSEAGVHGEMYVNEGHAAEMILKAAESEGVDLIVMSTHGRSGVARWVYGSVAGKVLHGAPCPLLLIRARPTGA